MAIAESLVETALQRLLADAEHTGYANAMIAIESPRAPLALPPKPAKRCGRKPGPKPKRAYTRRAKAVDAPAATLGGVDLSARHCRKCHKAGLAVPVAGSDRSVRCGGCGFRWNIRVKKNEAAGPPSAAGRASKRADPPVEAADVCIRCDHHQDMHDGVAGKCLVKRCTCEGFYR